MAVEVDRDRTDGAIFNRVGEMPRGQSLIEIRRRRSGRMKWSLATCSNPTDAAKWSAASPVRNTCGPWSIRYRARLIGALVVLIPATAPARRLDLHDRRIKFDFALFGKRFHVRR